MRRVDAEERVFSALANAHRRELLDRLAAGPATTGELSERLSPLSRFAVMQHLEVLESAGLVTHRRSGRERVNSLNAVPLREVYARWVGELADRGARDLLALRRYLTEESRMNVTAELIEESIELDAGAERVMRALTTEVTAWATTTYGGDRVRAIVFDGHVGGRMREDWGDGAGWDWGVITAWDPPSRLSLRRQLYPGVTLDTEYRLEETDGRTVLHSTKVAVGPMSGEQAEVFQEHGRLERVAEPLRAHLAGS